MTFPQAGGREKQMRYCGTAKTNSSRRPRPGPPRGSIFGWWRSLAPSSAGISRCRLCGNPALSNPEINPCRRVGGLRRVSFGTVFAPARDARLDRAQAENLAVSREPRPRGAAPCGNQDANLSGAQRPGWILTVPKFGETAIAIASFASGFSPLGSLCDPSDDCTEN
jgi:hypothetical protein